MTLVTRKGQWLSAKVADQLLMMSPEHENYIGLTAVGARIWELLEAPTTLEAICTTLTREYEVSPEQARRETESFLQDLASHGAIALDPPPAA
jgi:hypothetical protein